MAGAAQRLRHEARRLDHHAVRRHTSGDGHKIFSAVRLVCFTSGSGILAEGREQFIKGLSPGKAYIHIVGANHYRNARLRACQIGLLRIFNNNLAVDHGTGISGRHHAGHIQAVHDGFSRKRAQLFQRGCIHAGNSFRPGEYESAILGGGFAVRSFMQASAQAFASASRLDDGLLKEIARQRRIYERVDRHAARRLAEQSHVVSIAAKCGNVLLHPLQRRDLIQVAVVAQQSVWTLARESGMGEETEASEPVVEADKDHSAARKLRTIVDGRRTAAVDKPASMNPDHYRQRMTGTVGRRPHVEHQATACSRAHTETLSESRSNRPEAAADASEDRPREAPHTECL